MSELPRIIQRAPYILYGAAIVVFAASWLLTVAEANMGLAYAEPGNPLLSLAKWRGLYQAALEAIYIAAYGFLSHILLAIWQRGAVARPTEVSGD